MTVQDLREKLSLETLVEGNMSNELHGCYIGDLLSWVMAKAKSGNVWLTVMGNVNSIGVAVMSDIACIVLTDQAAFDEPAKQRAEENQVPVLRTPESSYQTALRIAALYEQEK